mmetsp:Transcript_10552/g.20376  ORF Transcript_10552/g.20376 Transcript_10552/m.20376 type:complete len:325 (+) Transcript_10552:190-1164(+)
MLHPLLITSASSSAASTALAGPTGGCRPRVRLAPAPVVAVVAVTELGAGWLGVIQANAHVVLFLIALGHCPWLVNLRRRHVLELGEPVAQVLAVRIVVLGLLRDVEPVDAAASEAGGGDPVSPVGADVVVEEETLEVVCALAPVELQVERQVRGHVLPSAIRHKARRRELAHVCVHERHPRLALLPSLQCWRVVNPFGLFAYWAARPEDLAAVLLAVQTVEVPPDKLEDKPICRLVLHARRLVARALARDEARREAAVREPRRELARVVGTEHPVASLEVRLEAVLVPKVVLEPAERHGLAAVKGHHSSRIGGDGKGVRVVAKR